MSAQRSLPEPLTAALTPEEVPRPVSSPRGVRWWRRRRSQAAVFVLAAAALLLPAGPANRHSQHAGAAASAERTPLEGREDEVIAAWLDAGGNHTALLRQGLRVAPPDSWGGGGTAGATLGCTPASPVAGTEYGVYYLPSDELYASSRVLTARLVCFAAEQDAIQAGYRHGPH